MVVNTIDHMGTALHGVPSQLFHRIINAASEYARERLEQLTPTQMNDLLDAVTKGDTHVSQVVPTALMRALENHS